jgi:hypothetical protein
VVLAAAVLFVGSCSTQPGCVAGPSGASAAIAKPATEDRKPGNLKQVITKPGSYTVGVDVEPGLFKGIARDDECTYSTNRRIDGKPIPHVLNFMGTAAPALDFKGDPQPTETEFALKPGDVSCAKPEPCLWS